MTSQQTSNPNLPELAGEYALGVLEGEELMRARELERTSTEFRDEVARWTVRLAPMLEEVNEVRPPASAFGAIERRIARSGATDNVIELRRSLKRWRWAATGMSALAASLAIVVLTGVQPAGQSGRPVTAPAAPPMVAMLNAPEAGTKVVASWDPQAHQLVLAVPGELPSDTKHSHELWVIPRDGKPRSLGTMPASRQMHMRLAEALARLLEQGATIAISVEPPGGSPTGSPTGVVVASGALKPA